MRIQAPPPIGLWIGIKTVSNVNRCVCNWQIRKKKKKIQLNNLYNYKKASKTKRKEDRQTDKYEKRSTINLIINLKKYNHFMWNKKSQK